MKSARIGIVGSGGISELHLTGMGRHPDEVTVVALVERDEEARKARAAEFGIEAT
jgi:predicted dehydrogenase